MDIFEVIKLIVEKYKLKSKIKFLCLQAGVSRSGYYNYSNSKKSRDKKEINDLESKGLILKDFNRYFLLNLREREKNLPFNN